MTKFQKMLELRLGVVSLLSGYRTGGPHVRCPRVLIQYIRSYPSHLQAISSIHNLRARHAVVTGTHITWGEEEHFH